VARTFVPDLGVQATAARLLALALGMTAASFALNLLVPQLATTEQAVVFIGAMAVVLFGFWQGLARAEPNASSSPRVWLAVAVAYVAWLALIWWLALSSAFRSGGRIQALPVAIVLPLLIGLPLLLRSRRIGAVLDATPATWLIGLQVYRVFGSVFLANWVLGTLSGVFAVPAGAGDTLVGLLALPVAAYVAAGPRAARGWAVAWNVLGIVDLVDAVVLGFLSTPGPLQLIAPAAGGPSPITLYPLVMIPAFAVPSSILLHALSLRQLRRRERRGAPAALEMPTPSGAGVVIRSAGSRDRLAEQPNERELNDRGSRGAGSPASSTRFPHR